MNTPLSRERIVEACCVNEFQFIEENLKKIDFDFRDDKGRDYLMIAIQSGSIKTALDLVTKSNLRNKDKRGRTALMMAFELSSTELLHEILFYCEDIKETDNEGKTPIDFCDICLRHVYKNWNSLTYERSALYNRVPKMQILLDRYDMIYDQYGLNLCIYAAYNRDIELIEHFAKRGLIIDFGDATCEMTPLIISCRLGYFDVAEKLLQYGCDSNKQDIFGNTAGMYCCMRGDFSFYLEMVKNYNLNPDLRNKKGQKALELEDKFVFPKVEEWKHVFKFKKDITIVTYEKETTSTKTIKGICENIHLGDKVKRAYFQVHKTEYLFLPDGLKVFAPGALKLKNPLTSFPSQLTSLNLINGQLIETEIELPNTIVCLKASIIMWKLFKNIPEKLNILHVDGCGSDYEKVESNESFFNLPKTLRILYLSDLDINSISLPDNLRTLILSSCSIKNRFKFPETLIEVEMSKMNLMFFPSFPLNIESIDITHNKIDLIPNVGIYKNLIYLDASHNRLFKIPKGLNNANYNFEYNPYTEYSEIKYKKQVEKSKKISLLLLSLREEGSAFFNFPKGLIISIIFFLD